MLFGAPTWACAQGASLGTDASSAFNCGARQCRGERIRHHEKGDEANDNPSVGQAGTATLGEGAAPNRAGCRPRAAKRRPDHDEESGSNPEADTATDSARRTTRASGSCNSSPDSYALFTAASMAEKGRTATVERAVARRYPYAGSIEKRLSVGQRPFGVWP